jgi:hypothetical protein
VLSDKGIWPGGEGLSAGGRVKGTSADDDAGDGMALRSLGKASGCLVDRVVVRVLLMMMMMVNVTANGLLCAAKRSSFSVLS